MLKIDYSYISNVASFVLLLPGGVLVEDHRVAHNDQEGLGSCNGHVESLQRRYTHLENKELDKH